MYDDGPVWRIHVKNGAVEVDWYTNYKEEEFLTAKVFGTEEEAEAWRKEFWEAYWRFSGALPKLVGTRRCDD